MSKAPPIRPPHDEVLPSPDGSPVTCWVFKNGKLVERPESLDEISEILQEEDSLVWFDVVDPGPDDLKLLQEEFNLHPVAVEDAIQEHERPKIETYETYWFVVIVATTVETERPVFHEIAIFAGEKFLVTVRHRPAYPLEEIKERWCAHPERLRHGGGFLLYVILDAVVDGYLPIAEIFQDHVDDLEEVLFANRPVSQDVLPQIFRMKKDAHAFRRAVLPMRDILNPIIRGDISLFPQYELPYYRDVYDHAVLVIDQLDTLRDVVNSALEIHLSVTANRQNEVAKQLTIIATIFLPLSFIVGFFGQNFGFLINDIGNREAFFVFGIGTEVVTLALTVAYFKTKGWF